MLRLDNSGPNFCSTIKNVILVNIRKQMVQGIAEEVSFEWSHRRIFPTDSGVRTTDPTL